MYIASGTHWGLNIYTSMKAIQDPQAWAALPIEVVYMWSVVTTIALFLNVGDSSKSVWHISLTRVGAKFWISDMVVMWRACVFWGWPRHVKIPFIIFVGLPVGVYCRIFDSKYA